MVIVSYHNKLKKVTKLCPDMALNSFSDPIISQPNDLLYTAACGKSPNPLMLSSRPVP